MTFVQLIDCKTNKYDDVNALLDTWADATKGKRTATHAVMGRDRSEADHLLYMVELPWYEEAMKNSALPETSRIFEELVALCDETPSFTDLDRVRDVQLNKETAARFFLELCKLGEPEGFREVFAEDYHDHDIANREADTRGPEGMREEVAGYRQAFPDFRFIIEDQVAEKDCVVTRWSWTGTNTGEMWGRAPTGKKVEMVGTTTFRFEKDKIKEGWWHWDVFGMLSQLGKIEMKD